MTNANAPRYEPSVQEIKTKCAEFRGRWSSSERISRRNFGATADATDTDDDFEPTEHVTQFETPQSYRIGTSHSLGNLLIINRSSEYPF